MENYSMKNAFTLISLVAAFVFIVFLVLSPFKESIYRAVSSPSGSTNEAHPSVLEAICKNYVVKRFSRTIKNAYGEEVRFEVPNYTYVSYGAVAKRGTFNNHAFVIFVADVDRYRNNRLESRDSIPYKYCVFGENSNIIALEREEH